MDVRVRNIFQGYHAATGRIPDPAKVVDALNSSTGNESAFDWQKRFAPLSNPTLPLGMRNQAAVGDFLYDGPLDGIPEPTKLGPRVVAPGTAPPGLPAGIRPAIPAETQAEPLGGVTPARQPASKAGGAAALIPNTPVPTRPTVDANNIPTPSPQPVLPSDDFYTAQDKLLDYTGTQAAHPQDIATGGRGAAARTVEIGATQEQPRAWMPGYYMGKTPLMDPTAIQQVMHVIGGANPYLPYSHDYNAFEMSKSSLLYLVKSRQAESGDKGDPALFAKKMVFDNALQFYLYGNPAQQTAAAQNMKAVSQGDFATQQIISKLQLGDPTVSKIVYQAAIVGRPSWETPRQAMLSFGARWGVDTLPADQQKVYAQVHDAGMNYLAGFASKFVKAPALDANDWAKRTIPLVSGVEDVFNKGAAATIGTVNREMNLGVLYALAYADKVTAEHPLLQITGSEGNVLAKEGIDPHAAWKTYIDQWLNQPDHKDMVYAVASDIGGPFDPNKGNGDVIKMADFLIQCKMMDIGNSAIFGAGKMAAGGAYAAAKAAIPDSVTPYLMDNVADRIALRTNPGNEASIREFLGLPDHGITSDGGRSLQAIVGDMAKSKDPTEVRGLIDELQKTHPDVNVPDAGHSALIRGMRMHAYINGDVANHSNIIQNMVTMAPFQGETSLVQNADRGIRNLANAYKMGLGKSWTPADAAQTETWASKVYMAGDDLTAKRAIFDQFYDKMQQNMSKLPDDEWAKLDASAKEKAAYSTFDTWGDSLRGRNARYMMADHRRSYASFLKRNPDGTAVKVDGQPVSEEVDKVVPTGTFTRLAAARNELERQWSEMELDPDRSTAEKVQMKKAAYSSGQKFDELRIAASIMNGNASAADLASVGLKSSDPDGMLAWARPRMDGVAHREPFATYQLQESYRHPRNPQMLMRYLRSPSARFAERTQTFLKMDKLMGAYKELVLGTMGFPMRVLVGDEWLRMVPEGTAARAVKSLITTGKTARANAVREGLIGEEGEGWISSSLNTKLNQWAGPMSDDWVSAMPGEPMHYSGFSAEIQAYKNEPFVKEWIEAKGAGRSDEDAADGLRRAVNANDDRGAALRDFLHNTNRSGVDTIFTKNTDQWLQQWTNKLKRITSDDRLAKAYRTGAMDKKDYDAMMSVDSSRELFDPVNVTNDPYTSGQLSFFQKAIYPAHELATRVTFPLMTSLANKGRELIFADRYYAEKAALEAAHPGADALEIRQLAAERSLDYVDKTQYSRNPTVAEDAIRNVVAFVPAYRQFFQYWGAQIASNPLLYGYIYYHDPAIFSSLGIGGYHAFMPSIPFGMPQAGQPRTIQSFVGNNLPAEISPAITLPMRFVNNVTGGSLGPIWKLPMLSNVNPKRDPASYLGDLLWGIHGGSMGSLTADPRAGEKLALEIVAGQVYQGMKPDLNAALSQMRGSPGWYGILEKLGVAHPEGVLGGLTKMGFPLGKVSYLPKPAQDYYDGQYSYLAANGDKVKEQQVLNSHPIFAYVQQHYWDQNALTREQFKLDPANAKYMGFIEAMHVYDNNNQVLVGTERTQALYNAGFVPVKTFVTDIQSKLNQMKKATNYNDAKKSLDDAIKTNDALASAKALAFAKGNQKLYAQIMNDWAHPHVTKDQNGNTTYAPAGVWSSLGHGLAIDDELTAQFKATSPPPSETSLKLGTSSVQAVKNTEGMLPTPLETSMETGPFAPTFAKFAADQQAAALDKVIAIGRTPDTKVDSWDLNQIGVHAGPALDAAQAKVALAYSEVHDAKNLVKGTGAAAKRAAMDAAYQKYRTQVLSAVPGGNALLGGLPTRLLNIGYFSTPQLENPGKQYVGLWKNVQTYIKTHLQQGAKLTVGQLWANVQAYEGVTSKTTPQAAVAAGNYTPVTWAVAILKGIGAPVTSGNVQAMTAWAQKEGGNWNNSASYNPINTTEPAPGATSINSVGVKAYTSWKQGIDSTIATLNNGYYPNILERLRTGTTPSQLAMTPDMSTWGSGVGWSTKGTIVSQAQLNAMAGAGTSTKTALIAAANPIIAGLNKAKKNSPLSHNIDEMARATYWQFTLKGAEELHTALKAANVKPGSTKGKILVDGLNTFIAQMAESPSGADFRADLLTHFKSISIGDQLLSW